MKIWHELKKQWRYMDGVVIICLIVLSFVPYVVFGINQAKHKEDTSGNIAIVTIKGKEVDRFDLNENTKHFEKTYYPGGDKYNIVEVDGTRIRVKEDNSPDQIAVMTSWISRVGQTSICLPHQLVIEIKAKNPDNDEDEMIMTY
ncbi:NusG domain II-containing protein [Vagococcus teuberi]|uniref:Uncharacterized protein n=2 Tax=Vagococcus TaxID=2737 RepID=A0A1J0A7L7_9ENTE|nr:MULTISPECIES: NusG domain II-containing protein [Vagococcus]APB31934.1 hypothetical protein BHY08_08995 [Vagococcus teuberi]OPF88907.1 hypothetical protein BW731_07865 [Vagococcus martis]RHH70072.1 NusG domain II-containing protein [Vagococcus sp. AM17-17]